MLTTKHYVPILKWKRAEQNALKDVTEQRKKFITPLIEIVPPKQNDKKPADEAYSEMITTFKDVRTKDIPKEILQAWGEDQIYVDLSPIYPLDVKQFGMKEIINNSLLLRLKPIPVFNLVDEPDYQHTAVTASIKSGNGVCIRITAPDLKDVKSTNAYLLELLDELNLKPDQVDILIDVKEAADELTYARSALNSQELVHLPLWRNFIFANGTFPQDLSEQIKEDDNHIQRTEWVNWKRQRASLKIARTPTFADYTIRHPIFNEITQNYPGTASLKYTVNDEWVVKKGDVRRFDMYLAHAAILITEDYFYGKDFSAGDSYIQEKADYLPEYMRIKTLDPSKAKGTGRAEDWIRAGINHHLSVAVDQLANPA